MSDGADITEEFDCPFCEFSEQSTDQDRLKRVRENHLEQHRGDVADKFRREYSGDCKNPGCEFSFPDGYEEHPGLTCPECGHSHLGWYVSVLGFVETTGV
jgi:hypothetical protein